MILSSIIDAVQSHVGDRAVLTSFGRQVEDERKAGSKRDLASILADEFPTAGHTRAFRLLNAAIETKRAGRGNPTTLTAVSFDGFQMASRQVFDVSASLAGLAVKFETTLLGLLASMFSSFSLNFLEKREAELAAATMLMVKHAGETDV